MKKNANQYIHMMEVRKLLNHNFFFCLLRFFSWWLYFPQVLFPTFLDYKNLLTLMQEDKKLVVSIKFRIPHLWVISGWIGSISKFLPHTDLVVPVKRILPKMLSMFYCFPFSQDIKLCSIFHIPRVGQKFSNVSVGLCKRFPLFDIISE